MTIPIFSELPDFLPSEPSLFTRSLCEKALEALSNGVSLNGVSSNFERSSYASVSATPLPDDAAITPFKNILQRLIEEYAHVAKAVQNLISEANKHQHFLEKFGVFAMYSRVDLPHSMERALQPLRGIVTAFPDIEQDLRNGIIPDNIVFRSAWIFFLRSYGHRAKYEGELATMRFNEDNKHTWRLMLGLEPIRKYDDEFGDSRDLPFKARILAVFWRKYVAKCTEIDRLRSDSMRRVAPLRGMLLQHAENLVSRGILPEKIALWKQDVRQILASPDFD